jgi:hypothetical protein
MKAVTKIKPTNKGLRDGHATYQNPTLVGVAIIPSDFGTQHQFKQSFGGYHLFI